MSSLVIRHLYQDPKILPEVGDWIYQAFWTDQSGVTVQDLKDRLKEAVNGDAVPISLVAYLNNVPVGTVNLIESDDDARPHLKPWLAALYVKPEVRSQGVGAELVRALLNEAHRLKIDQLYLGTERPDFYARLGAVIHEMASPTFAIMSFDI